MPSKTKVIVNNKRVDMLNQPLAYVLNSSIEHFKQDSAILETTGIDSLVDLSVDALFAMGITQIDKINPNTLMHFNMVDESDSLNVKLTADYSFMSMENKDQGIDNINIIDPDIPMLSPQLTSTKDKFLAVDDPFYEQDDETIDATKQELRKRQKLKRKPLIKVAVDMCAPQLSKEVKNRNRYFIDFKYLKRRGKM